jgi:hypothetical protein
MKKWSQSIRRGPRAAAPAFIFSEMLGVSPPEALDRRPNLWQSCSSPGRCAASIGCRLCRQRFVRHPYPSIHATNGGKPQHMAPLIGHQPTRQKAVLVMIE